MMNPRECYKPPEICLRPISRSDIPLVSEVLDREGWYSPLHIVNTMESSFPGSFLGAYKENSLLGSCVGVSYGPNLGAAGELVVDQKYRHLGYGLALADQKLAEIGIWDKNKSIYSAAVLHMLDKYKSRYGFNESWKLPIYSGTSSTIKEMVSDVQGEKLTERNIDMIFEYDSKIFPGNRMKYWKTIIDERNGCVGFVASDDRKVTGFGIIHPCSAGYRIAPLYADSSKIARFLLYNLTSNIAETDRIVIEVPDINNAMKTIMNECGFIQQSSPRVRIHTNSDVITNVEPVFGISTGDISVI